MMATDPQTIVISGGTLAIVGFVWRAAWLVRDIRAVAESTMTQALATSKKLEEFMDQILKITQDHETRIRDQEGKMAVVWDGYERRKGGGKS